MSLTTRGRFMINYSLNFSSAILLIYLSKWLFRRYPISGLTLTIINCFLSGILATIVLQCIPKVSTNKSPPTDRCRSVFRMLIISGSFSAFITFSNLSLQYNTLGTYQLIKLQVPPTLMLVEFIQLSIGLNSSSSIREKFHRNYSSSVLFAFGIIVLGTLVNTYSDLRFHPYGITFACISVISNAIYQALVQGDKASSLYERIRFLQIQTFTSGLILFSIWPFLDPMFAMNQYVFTDLSALILLFVCGLLAFLVNSSVIWCIKDDTAIGYNMVGQLKTLFIVFVGSALFGELLTIKQIIGIVSTTAGCLIYVYITYENKEYYKHQQQPGLSNV